MKNSSQLLLVIFLISLGSCSKSDSAGGTEKSKTEYLTASSWKITAATINPGLVFGSVTITDLYSIMPACQKDNTRKFNNGGFGVEDEGATKCDPSDDQTTNFTWAFIESETKLKTTMDGQTDTVSVIKLDATVFTGSQVMDGSKVGGTAGTNYTVTFTFNH